MAKSRSALRSISIAVLAAAGLAGLVYGYFALRRHAASRAWTRFAACLTGPPLAETDSGEVRVRRIWMTVAHTSEVTPPGVDAWPDRCAEHGRALAKSWAVRQMVPALPPIAEKVAVQIDAEDLRPTQVELLWATGYALPWNDAAAASVPAPPSPAVPLIDGKELRAVRRACPGFARLVNNGVDVQPRDQLLFVTYGPRQERRVCTIGASPSPGPFGAIRCALEDVRARSWNATEPRFEDVLKARGKPPEQGGPTMKSCHTKSATVVVAATTETALERETLDVYFVTERGVPKPLSMTRAILDPKHYPNETLGPLTLACGDDDVRLSWASGTATKGVQEHALWFGRCTPEGCTSEMVKITGLPTKKIAAGTWGSEGEDRWNFIESPIVIDLGERALLLWDRGDAIAARVAARDALQQAEDRLIVETYRPWATHREIPGAVAAAFQDLSVVVRGDAAVALIPEHVIEIETSQRDAVYPVRIGADGSIRALACEE